jgi:hypothetical protein
VNNIHRPAVADAAPKSMSRTVRDIRRPDRPDHRVNRDHRAGSNTRPVPSATTSGSTTAIADSTRERPAGTKASVRPQPRQLYEQKFSTIEEAVSGVPQEVVQARRKEGLCLRCGYSKHTALHCHREPNSQMPRQIAAVEAGKHDREGSDDEEETTQDRCGCNRYANTALRRRRIRIGGPFRLRLNSGMTSYAGVRQHR